ncbi:hypothetical protein X977_5013 [Burkholderia pseudomallei MSHR7504]|nr:hypothetical protein X977_5013 [Burkholderia pseudomallei MSHR7504]
MNQLKLFVERHLANQRVRAAKRVSVAGRDVRRRRVVAGGMRERAQRGGKNGDGTAFCVHAFVSVNVCLVLSFGATRNAARARGNGRRQACDG